MIFNWKKHVKSLRPLDFAVFVLSAGLTVFAAITAYARPAAASHLYIQTPDGEFLYDLSRDTEIEINGPLGVTRAVISGGAARVLDSPCREKICVNSKPLSAGGDWTACLPNRIFLQVTGGSGDTDADIDTLSY